MKSFTVRLRTRRSRILVALVAVAVTAVGVLVVGPGYHASQVRMYSGAAWLASNQVGEATLVDGASAEVKANVPVAQPDTALSIAHQGSNAFVLNRETGGLNRVESATERLWGPVPVLPASDGLAVLPAQDVVYDVDVHSGMVASVDPNTLESKGEPQELAEAIRPGSVVVDGRGRLWAIDDKTGDLVWLVEGERRTRSAAARTGSLAVTKGQPVLVDAERGTAELLYPETGAVARSVRPDLSADDVVVVSGSSDRSRLLIATGGELIVCTFDSGSCAEPVKIGSSGAELGSPVEVNNHAVVPDYATGQATIVDLASSAVVAQRQLFEQPTRFELVTRDGIVFFNDPNSNVAGVLDLAGEVRTITKYTDETAEGDSSVKPDPRVQGDQVTKVDHKKPGLGIPGQSVKPSQNNPAPPASNPAASIVVKPGSRGVVGDEFELSMVLQPAAAATTRWQFGDGTEAVGATVRHRWQQPGAFTVRAAATFGTGGQVRAETAVTVDPAEAPPHIAALHVRRPRPVIGELVHFSADSGGKPEKWAWTVTKPGMPTPEVTAQTAEFAHRFATPGTYTVTLTITRGTQTAQSSRQLTVARGAVKAWGNNWGHQLEIPPAASSGVVAIDAGLNHGLALKADGTVIAWGSNIYKQLDVPPDASGDVLAISAGGNHNVVLKSNGSVIAWGNNFDQESEVPLEAKRDVIAIAGGNNHTLALKSDGSVVAWGSNSSDQSVVPREAKSGVVAIAAGIFHSVAMKADGSMVVWGNTYLGEGNVPPEATSGVRTIAAGGFFSLALKMDGSVVGWGNNDYSQLKIPPAAKSGVIAIDTSGLHSLALKSDGSVVAWGDNQFGEGVVPPEYSSGGVLAVAGGERFSMVLVEAID